MAGAVTRYNEEIDGVTYFYTVESDPRVPGQFTYGLQVFVNNSGSSGSGFATSISGTINDVVSEFQKELNELQQRAARQQQTLARLEQDLQNPNLTPAERTALQNSIDEFKNGTIAETQAAIAGTQRAIAQVQSNSAARFEDMQKTLEAALVPPPATPTVDNTAAPDNAAPTGTNTLQGAASDDSGAQPSTPTSETTEAAGTNAAGTANVGTGTSETPSTNAPEPLGAERENTPTENDTQGNPPYPNEEFLRLPVSPRDRPGKRLKNPLTFMSSYNYQLSLYIITPDAYDAFLANGRRNINVFAERIGESVAATETNRQGGAFLLAQSGGAGPDPRAPGVKYDYYIDNLSFTHLASAKETSAPTGNIEFSFQIIEPYGFSFISNLKRAQAQFDEFSRKNTPDEAARFASAENSSVPFGKQFFILGIRFFGWDAQGRPVLGDETFEGSSLDPDSSGTGAIFETFYELVIYEIKYKIDGKATVYNIKANIAPASLGANVKKGYIFSPISASGSTVRDYLSGPSGLITKLNQEQQALKDNGTVTYPTTYKIRWIADDAEDIALSSIVSEARENKANQPGAPTENTEEANDTTGTTATPNRNQVEIGFAKDTPIIQAIDTVFSRSKYIEDALTLNYTDNNEFDPETDTAETVTTPRRPFKWFRITPSISNVKWDSKIKDWAYDITYEIETYLVPLVDSPFVSGTTRYYGPHKRYDYWYTGENSEVLSYTQTLDNQYYQDQPAGNPSDQQTDNTEGNANRVAQAPNTTQNLDLTSAGGTMSTAAAAAVKNALYDPGSYTKATVDIMGDPDFLMQEITAGYNGINQAYDRFYGSGFTIKPTGGQVFFEIDFKEAVDYSANEVSDLLEDGRGISGIGGTLSINDSILFWDYPAGARDVVKGISYTLTKVKSSFRNGLFTQTLEAFINDFGTGTALRDDARQELSAAQTQDGATTSRAAGSSRDAASEAFGLRDQATGTQPDAAPGTAQTANPQPAPTPAPSEPTT